MTIIDELIRLRDLLNVEIDRLSAEAAKSEVASKPIHNGELSVKAFNVLIAYDITTWDQLAKLRASDLLKMKNFGKVALREVKVKLAEHGLELRGSCFWPFTPIYRPWMKPHWVLSSPGNADIWRI